MPSDDGHFEQNTDQGKGAVVSLFDRTGNMVRPWARAGYTCYCVDIDAKNTDPEYVGDGVIYYAEADIRTWIPPLNTRIEIVFGFPPCDNLAVSGARWMQEKGLDGLDSGVTLFKRAREIAEKSGAPYMLENPVSTISSYWREPDHTFHPYEYDGYTDQDEAYSKKTCLWTGGGFVLPDQDPADEFDDRIHKMPPSEDRANKRSETPTGFAQAVFEANTSQNTVAVGSARDNRSQNNVCADGGGVENKRDAVWLATIDIVQERSGSFRRGEVEDRLNVDVHPNTIRSVLSSMETVGVLARDPNSPLWRLGPHASDVVGAPVPVELSR